MRTCNRWLCLALVLMVGALPARAADIDKYLPDDTEAVLTVNFKQLTQAGLVKPRLGLLTFAIMSSSTLQKAMTDVGFDPLKDLTTITVAIPGGKAPEDGLILVEGTFHPEKIDAKANELAKTMKDNVKVLKSGNYTLYQAEPRGGRGIILAQPIFSCIVDKNLVAFSASKDSLVELLDKKAGKKQTKLKKEVATLLGQVDRKQSITLVALTRKLGDQAVQGLMSKVKNLTGGITIGDDLKADFVIAAKNAGDAKAVAEAIQDSMKLASSEIAGASDVLDQFKVQVVGSNVRIQGRLTEEIVEKAIKNSRQPAPKQK